jgi:uncharacterized cupredoxin-like copper-binding protein
MSGAGRDRRVVVVGAVAALVLAAWSTVGIAAAAGAFRSGDGGSPGCSPRSLPGTVVDVRLMNMGGAMMGGQMSPMGGTMRVVTNRQRVPAGVVSFRVGNAGTLVHELVILPLTAGPAVGQRRVGSDNRVDEEGGLGEASSTCGEGAGDGISPGTFSWVTVNLPSGDYELVCNLAGHYAAGMYTGLQVG